MYSRAFIHDHRALVPVNINSAISLTDKIDPDTGIYPYTGSPMPTHEKERLIHKLESDRRYKSLYPKKLRLRARKYINSLQFKEDMNDEILIDCALNYAYSKIYN